MNEFDEAAYLQIRISSKTGLREPTEADLEFLKECRKADPARCGELDVEVDVEARRFVNPW